jgi:hypothetical protein
MINPDSAVDRAAWDLIIALGLQKNVMRGSTITITKKTLLDEERVNLVMWHDASDPLKIWVKQDD